jgi:hypothetical protein
MPAFSANSRTSCHRAGDDDAVTRQDHGPLGIVNQFQRLLVLFGLGRQIRPISWQLRLRRFPVEFAGRLLRVFGDVDQHWTGPAGSRDIKCFSDRAGYFAGVSYQIIVLGDRQGHAGDVRLLECVGADQLAADLSGDADDRRRIEHGRGDSGHHVGRAWARGCDGDADVSAGARIAVGHVRRALLVAHQHVMDLAVFQRVIRRQDCAAGIPEHVLSRLRARGIPRECSLRSCSYQPLFLTFDLPTSPKMQKPTGPAFLAGRDSRAFQNFFVLSSLLPSTPSRAEIAAVQLRTTDRKWPRRKCVRQTGPIRV